MTQRPRVTLLLLTLISIFACRPCSAQKEHFDLVDWVDGSQIAAIQIPSPQLALEHMSDLDISRNTHMNELVDYFSSEAFEAFAQKQGIEFKLQMPNFDIDQVDATLSGPITVCLPARDFRRGWVAAIETKASSWESFQESFCDLFGLSGGTFDDGQLKVAQTSLLGTDLFEFGSTGVVAFLHKKHLILAGSEATAKRLLERLDSGKQPKRPFSKNRKYLLGLARSKAMRDQFELLHLYIDVSSTRQLIPSIPREAWSQFGLSEVVGTIVRISVPEESSDRQLRPQLAIDAWVSVTKPRSGILKAMLESPPIVESEIPDIESLGDANRLEMMILSCSPKQLLGAVSERVDASFGAGTFDKGVGHLERAERVSKGFVNQLVQGWNGLFLSVAFEQRQKQTRVPPMVFFGIDNQQDAADAITSLTARHVNLQKPESQVFDNRVFWLWSDRAVQQHRNKIQATIPAGFKSDIQVLDLDGFMIDGSFALHTRNSFLKNRPSIPTIPVNDDQAIREMLRFLKYREPGIVDSAFLLWAAWPRYWNSLIAGMEFQHNAAKNGPVTSDDDFARLLQRIGPLEEVDSVKELYSQVQIRIGKAMIDSYGQMVVVAAPADFGFRMTAMSFAQPDSGKDRTSSQRDQ